MAPLPKPVEMVGYQAVARKKMPYEIAVDDFFRPVAALKSLFAELVHVSNPERIALIPSVSYGISSSVKNLKIHAGQNVVLVDEIFPSNYYPWKRLVDENKAELKIVKRPENLLNRGRDWNENILEAIDNQTVAVAVPHVHWTDGTKFDLVSIRHRATEVGAALIVDGTQSVGALPFDVGQIQPDALVCAGYKWLLGPYSSGLAYFGDRFDGGVPLEESWMNRKNSEQFENLTNYQDEYKPAANRYNMGENSQFMAVPMLSKAIEMILEWGVAEIQNYCTNLAAPYLQSLLAYGFQMETPEYRSGHLTGLRLPKGFDMDIVKKATIQSKIYVSFRAGAMRISPHLYNG